MAICWNLHDLPKSIQVSERLPWSPLLSPAIYATSSHNIHSGLFLLKFLQPKTKTSTVTGLGTGTRSDHKLKKYYAPGCYHAHSRFPSPKFSEKKQNGKTGKIRTWKFWLSQDHLESYRFCLGHGRGEAVTSTRKLHETGVYSHCDIHMFMRLREGGYHTDKSLENRLSSIESPAITERSALAVTINVWMRQFPSMCGRNLKTEVIRGYGLNASEAASQLIATQNIAKGDMIAEFSKTATLWTSNNVYEFQALVDAMNHNPCTRNTF